MKLGEFINSFYRKEETPSSRINPEQLPGMVSLVLRILLDTSLHSSMPIAGVADFLLDRVESLARRNGISPIDVDAAYEMASYNPGRAPTLEDIQATGELLNTFNKRGSTIKLFSAEFDAMEINLRELEDSVKRKPVVTPKEITNVIPQGRERFSVATGITLGAFAVAYGVGAVAGTEAGLLVMAYTPFLNPYNLPAFTTAFLAGSIPMGLAHFLIDTRPLAPIERAFNRLDERARRRFGIGL